MANRDLERGSAGCLRQAVGLQARLAGACGRLPQSASDLHTDLGHVLQQAQRAELLRTPPFSIFNLLKLAQSAASRTFAIEGGVRDLTRRREPADPKEHLVRDDEAILHFSVEIREAEDGGALTLLAYRFELYYATEGSPPFIRFDFNPPGHENDDHGLRAHLHPGDDDLQVPSPVLTPGEVLSFLLYRYRRQRAAPRQA